MTHIAESHWDWDAGEKEVQLVAPLSPLSLTVLLAYVDLRDLVRLLGFELDEVIVLLIVGESLGVLQGHVLAGKVKSLYVDLLVIGLFWHPHFSLWQHSVEPPTNFGKQSNGLKLDDIKTFIDLFPV